MSFLTLVRHGQASYLEEIYDKLSELGERQARVLGEYWAARDVTFDLVYHGPAERHRRSGEIVAEAYHRAGKSWPEATIIDEFDEFDGEAVVKTFYPILAERHPHVRELVDACEVARGTPAMKVAVDRLFHAVARCWVAGEVSSPEIESWEQFNARVARGLDRVRKENSAESRVVIFTSAGPTAVTASLALEIPAQKTLQLAFSSRNASYSEFRMRPDRIRLHTFNSFPHLDDTSLLSYR
ncbi:MAG: histidine phosphatase family protein [bacterium]|nr:histidine phosphatase family protein [bacterium]